jgi:hypothetical protein
MFHLLGYDVNAGVNDSNVDETAFASDPAFSIRNGHYVFTEPYQVLAAYHAGASALRARFNVPSINAIAPHHIWGVNRSLTVPTPVVIEDYRAYPLRLPVAEEIAVQESGNLGAGNEHEKTFFWIAPPNWTRNVPDGILHLTVRATAAVTRGADSWGAFGALTFEQTLRGGWYSVVGAEVFEANSHAFLLNFPRQPQVQGRKLFPGGICLNAVGNVPAFLDRTWVGHWGTFHTFEPPTLAICATAAGAGTEEVRLDLVYHGDTPPPSLVSSAMIPTS